MGFKSLEATKARCTRRRRRGLAACFFLCALLLRLLRVEEELCLTGRFLDFGLEEGGLADWAAGAAEFVESWARAGKQSAALNQATTNTTRSRIRTWLV